MLCHLHHFDEVLEIFTEIRSMPLDMHCTVFETALNCKDLEKCFT